MIDLVMFLSNQSENREMFEVKSTHDIYMRVCEGWCVYIYMYIYVDADDDDDNERCMMDEERNEPWRPESIASVRGKR